MALPYVVMVVFSLIDLLAFEIFMPETKVLFHVYRGFQGQHMKDHLPAKEERIFYRKRQTDIKNNADSL